MESSASRAVRTAAVALLSLCAAGPASAAAQIGKAVRIAPSVSGTTGGQVKTIGSGDGVEQDEIIQTATAGNAQLRFIDATDLAIGPSSTVRLDKFVFNPAGSASRFVLNATKGAFRFATGKSGHGAYEIRTPAAVIGVRGTQFNFTIIGARLSLTVTQGQVIVCPLGLPRTSCFLVSAGQTIAAQPNRPVTLISGGGGGGGGRGSAPQGGRGQLPPSSPPQRPPRGYGPGPDPSGDYGPPPYGPGGYGPGPYGPGGYGPPPYGPGGYRDPGGYGPRPYPSRPYPGGTYRPRGDGYPYPPGGANPPRGSGYPYPPRGGGYGRYGPAGGYYRGGGAGPYTGGPYGRGGGPYGRGGGYGGRGGRGGGYGRGR